jgi:DNA-binding MarR family transcriptional regulator
MPKGRTRQLDEITKDFGRIWPVHLAAFTRLLIQLRGHFDGDLDLLLVLAVIGDRTRPEEWSPELLTYRQLTRPRAEEHFQVPINIQSVADYSGIPRETVRRKVKRLEELGWIKRDPSGLIGVTPKAGKDLERATNDSVAYLAALLMAFDSLLRPVPGEERLSPMSGKPSQRAARRD